MSGLYFRAILAAMRRPCPLVLGLGSLLQAGLVAADDKTGPAEIKAINRPLAAIRLLDPAEEEARVLQNWLAGGLHPRQMIAVANVEEKQAPAPHVPVEKANEILDAVLFGPETTGADDAKRRLDLILNRKIRLVDRLCGLTEDQKRKLELAGRGDVHRFLRRADLLREKLPDVVADGVTIEFARETRDLHDLVRHGPFDQGSMFGKSLRKVLTAEQLADYIRQRKEGTPKVRELLPDLEGGNLSLK